MPPRTWLLLSGFAFLIASPWVSARKTTLHVAPAGDDRWTGEKPTPEGKPDGPLGSLRGARDRIRALRGADPKAPLDPVTVRIAPGTYSLTEAVTFGPSDGSVTYRAEPGPAPVFDGGRAIDGLQATPEGTWVAKIPDVAAGRWTFEQLFVGGRRATRARTPDEFYHYIYKGAPKSVDLAGNRAFVARPEDLKPLLGLSPRQLADANVVIYHSWEASRHRIASVDPETGLVTLTGPTPWPLFAWGTNQRYHVGAKDVEVKDCRFEHIGIYGIWFRRGCTAGRVEPCALIDLGAGGVRIGEKAIPAKPAHATGKITVDDCIIRGAGLWFPGAVGVWIGQSGDNAITHNDIGDLPYTGVSVGWTWGYEASACRRNTIEYNRLHHLGRGVLSDLGGVYTLGHSEGTSVSHNVIHDVDSYNKTGAGGRGLYTDEGSTGIRLEHNIVWNSTLGSLHQHYGRENVVRNNILADSRSGQIMRSRAEDHLSYTFEHNIVYWTGGPLLTGTWKDRNFRLDHHLYFDGSGAPVTFAGRTLDEWRKTTGQDEHSLVADPLFQDPAALDFRLKPGSPALALGFTPIDTSAAGVRSGGPWAEEADAPVPPTRFAPELPPLVVREDFESPSPGEAAYTPHGAILSTSGHPELVTITDRAASQGRQSLKLADALGLAHSFDPHFYFHPLYDRGTVNGSFALRAEPGAVFSHELRDQAFPYRVGPNLQISGGKLRTADREVLDLPPGQWVRIEIRARLGDAEASTPRTWDLTITRPGEAPLRLADLPCTPGWKSVDWVGFVSDAEQPTGVYLDDLELNDRTP